MIDMEHASARIRAVPSRRHDEHQADACRTNCITGAVAAYVDQSFGCTLFGRGNRCTIARNRRDRASRAGRTRASEAP